MSGSNADCVLALPEDYTTKYGFQFSQFSPIAEVEEEESSVEDKSHDEQSPSLKRITLLSQQKQQLQRKENNTVSSKSQLPPPIKHPKPTTKFRESAKQQTPEDPSLPSKSSPKTPLSPVCSANQSLTSVTTVKPVQPVYPLPDRQPSESSASSLVKDKSSPMQQYKAHQSTRSSSGSSGNRPHSLSAITSPTSSVDHSNSDNNSGASTPLLYGDRTSPSGSSGNTSTSGSHQQRHHAKPPIALMQHSYVGDSTRRVTDKPIMTGFSEPLDVTNLSQCSNSSRESNASNRSKREMRSPERQMKFSSPDSQYSIESHLRNADMPTAALRHSSGGQRLQHGREEQEVYMQPKRLGGYISDGAMSVTSSIEELTAINQTSDYTDQPLQPNVVIVKPQPVASSAAYYQHPGVKDRYVGSSHDHKQHVHGGPSSGQGVTSPNSKQGNSTHSYHTPQFPSKGFPSAHHQGQFKSSYPPSQPAATNTQQHWATQRQQGPPGNSYSKQGKSSSAVSPPGMREGKPRGYLAADGTDYTNEMIAAYRAHEAAVNGDFMYLYRVVTSGEIPPTLADHHKSTLIHKTALNGHLRCLSYLVKNSPRDAINLLDDNLLTPVLLSIQGGHLDCVRWLVDETDVEMVVPDAGGETLLHHAAFHGKVLILEWLLDRVKNSSDKIPDVVDDSGVTPAHFAAQQGHLDCLQLLYDKGCCLTMADHDNQRPIDWADASNQMLCSHYLLMVETCLQLSNDVALLKQQLMKAQTDNQNLRDIIGGMEKEHSKNMNKIQLQYEAKVEKIRENYVDLTAKLIQDFKENQHAVGPIPSRNLSDSSNTQYHYQPIEKEKTKVPKDSDRRNDDYNNISGLAQEVLRKRQSSVAQRMLENREVRRRQPVLAGRASPLSPSLHRMETFNLPTPENENTKSHMKKASGRVVTFAPHVEEFPKSPSPNYGVDQSLHTLIEERPSQTEQSQRYHENAD